VKVAAERLGLRIVQPTALRDPTLLERFGARPDLLVVIAYGLLLPPWVLAWPRAGCVNLHASLLPRWRGAAPIQRAILAGDSVTGISVMQMDEGLDTGPVYLEREIPIGRRESAAELHDRLAALAASTLAEVLPGLLAGLLRATPQEHARATTAPKITKAEAPLDWRESAAALERRVRAFNPWPVAETRLDDGRRLRVWQARAVEPEPARSGAAAPGTVVAAGRDGIDVATGAGVLRLERVQPPSGRVMDAAAYLAAHPLEASALFVS
jgi:methionyl-tRNA formyltransferase